MSIIIIITIIIIIITIIILIKDKGYREENKREAGRGSNNVLLQYYRK